MKSDNSLRLQPVMCPGVKLLRRGRESWRNGFVELVPPLAVASVCRVRPVPVVVGVGVKHQLLVLKVVLQPSVIFKHKCICQTAHCTQLSLFLQVRFSTCHQTVS